MDTDKLLESVAPDTRSPSDRARADASTETIFAILIVGLGAALISFAVLSD